MITTKENSKLQKNICMFLLIAGFVYSLILPFCWGNNPFDPMGTLSLLCEHRKIWFWIWIILDGGALFLNINYMYKKYGGANKFIKALPIIAMVFAFAIALTLDHSIADWNPKRVVHWVATGGYVAFLVASTALYAIKNIKKGKIFRYILFGVFGILILFLLWFIILGKSGMMETVPRALLEILLFTVNFIV
ncbi:MAG: hypothetical protein ACI4F5_08185 [Acutalibacteraceae bacterium]